MELGFGVRVCRVRAALLLVRARVIRARARARAWVGARVYRVRAAAPPG